VDERRRTILWTIAAVFVTVVIVYAAYLARHVLLLIYIAALFAIGFSPVVRFLELRGRVPRWLAILLLYLVFLGSLALVLRLIFPPLVEQAKGLWVAAPHMFESAQNYLLEKGILTHRFTMREAVQHAPGVGSGAAGAAGAVAGAAIGIAGGLFAFVTILILTFYLLLEASSLRGVFLRLFPPTHRTQIADAANQVTSKVSAWLNGQLLLAGTIGTTSAIGLWILGIPFFYVLALISAVGELIPIVGPFLAAIPAIGVALTISYKKALFVAVFFVLQQQLENHVLVPRIMSRQVGVSAATVIVALLIGGELFGILGAVLAVPTAAILQVVYHQTLAPDEG
jgi:predicted PurR-regulated permease PerM